MSSVAEHCHNLWSQRNNPRPNHIKPMTRHLRLTTVRAEHFFSMITIPRLSFGCSKRLPKCAFDRLNIFRSCWSEFWARKDNKADLVLWTSRIVRFTADISGLEIRRVKSKRKLTMTSTRPGSMDALSPATKSKDILCENVIIYGKCRHEDKGTIPHQTVWSPS